MGTSFVRLHRGFTNARAWTFTRMSAGAFESLGEGCALQLPLRLDGEQWMSIGDEVFVGAGSWLQVLYGPGHAGRLEIGDRSALTGSCVISAAQHVRLGRSVLLARNVYISDHSHGFADVSRPIIDQGIDSVAPVEICAGAWLGQNVVVCPGVRIGRGAVIGANSVVKDDVPDHAVAVGAPARVVRLLAGPAELAR